jgi:hypothetical protein
MKEIIAMLETAEEQLKEIEKTVAKIEANQLDPVTKKLTLVKERINTVSNVMEGKKKALFEQFLSLLRIIGWTDRGYTSAHLGDCHIRFGKYGIGDKEKIGVEYPDLNSFEEYWIFLSSKHSPVFYRFCRSCLEGIELYAKKEVPTTTERLKLETEGLKSICQEVSDAVKKLPL